MKTKFNFLLTICIIVIYSNFVFSQSCEPYLNQTVPTNIPVLFPPSNLQANSNWFWHGTPVFSPDGTEMYFVKYQTDINKHSIWFTKCENGTWSEPTLASFSQIDSHDNNPRFSTSNDTLYFHSERPNANIYRVIRVNGIWGTPVSLNLIIPSGKSMGLQFSVSENGNIYSELSNLQGNTDIYCWKFLNGSYSSPYILTGLNSTDYDGFPTIDKKERFLIFSSDRTTGTTDYDIFISFKNKNNTWTTAQNLSIGSGILQATAWSDITADGKYLFFTKSNNYGYNPYWVNAQFLYDMIPPKPYWGETPPTNIPKRFGSNYLLSDGIWWWMSSPSFDTTGTEFHFTKYLSDLSDDNHQIYFMKETEGIWSMPQQPDFISDSEECTPFFSEDNNTIYFVSDRDGSRKMYFVKKTELGWSEVQLINFPYNELPGDFGFGFSITSDSVIYFSASDDLYKSVPQNNEYLTFEELPNEINSVSYDNSPFISPDESYLIFASNRSGGFGYHDLYISFRKQDGTWVEAINMGNTINNVSEDYSPRLSTDGNYLFFTSARTYDDYGYNAYWVDADIINNYNPFAGIHLQTDEIEIELYPNPANDFIIIDLAEDIPTKIEIFNIFGQSIYLKEIIGQSEKVDISNMNAGIYFIEISNFNLKYQQKLIVE